MDTENQSNIPDTCTHDHVLYHVDTHSRPPPSAVLRTASAAEVGKIVGCTVLAPFLKDFFPAAFGVQKPSRERPCTCGTLITINRLH